MKIVLLRTPSFLSPIIKKIFEATNSKKSKKKAKSSQKWSAKKRLKKYVDKFCK